MLENLSKRKEEKKKGKERKEEREGRRKEGSTRTLKGRASFCERERRDSVEIRNYHAYYRQLMVGNGGKKWDNK